MLTVTVGLPPRLARNRDYKGHLEIQVPINGRALTFDKLSIILDQCLNYKY